MLTSLLCEASDESAPRPDVWLLGPPAGTPSLQRVCIHVRWGCACSLPGVSLTWRRLAEPLGRAVGEQGEEEDRREFPVEKPRT